MITDDQHLICENWLNGGYDREEAQEMLEKETGLTPEEADALLTQAQEENPDADV